MKIIREIQLLTFVSVDIFSLFDSRINVGFRGGCYVD